LEFEKEINIIENWFKDNETKIDEEEKNLNSFKNKIIDLSDSLYEYISSREESINLLKGIRNDLVYYLKKSSIFSTVGSGASIVGTSLLMGKKFLIVLIVSPIFGIGTMILGGLIKFSSDYSISLYENYSYKKAFEIFKKDEENRKKMLNLLTQIGNYLFLFYRQGEVVYNNARNILLSLNLKYCLSILEYLPSKDLNFLNIALLKKFISQYSLLTVGISLNLLDIYNTWYRSSNSLIEIENLLKIIEESNDSLKNALKRKTEN
jgi:hypothetical protein